MKPVFTLKLGTGTVQLKIGGKFTPSDRKITGSIVSEYQRHLPKESK